MTQPCPAISVVLPVWNAAATLPATLESLLAQTGADFEVLAVDDGSTDATPDLLAAFAAQDARIRPARIAHGGIVAALNHGLALARGRYIARMDADDTCHPQRLTLQCAFLDAHPHIGLVGCRVDFGGDRDCCGGYARHVDWVNTLLDPTDIALARFRESPFAHPSVMFRAELPGLHGAYLDGPFPEDYELWLRWMDAGVAMAKLPHTLLTWNDPPGRLSRTHPNYAEDGFYSLKGLYLARWLARHNPRHPEVWVVGAGRTSRRRARLLMEQGITVRAWIDIDPRKIGNRVDGLPVLGREAMPAPGEGFLVAYLAGHGAAEELAAFLDGAGYVQGRDYILAA